ncbi:hypothetical protein ARMSODRAFT_1023018 [Armillaria solidipes]|uniref:Uncharacterized protein n=1 Tax=Armillaria solidipes TaxID=1076256 RepID=A0A2H3BNX0_9AGAR|nr:hypothetical protein ARMSODRAFT_1023018 [Armillaria solidipes]
MPSRYSLRATVRQISDKIKSIKTPCAIMGRVRTMLTTHVPWKNVKSSQRPPVNSQQQAGEVYDPSDPLSSDKFRSALLTASVATLTDVNTSFQFHKNRKMSNLQTGLLKELLPDYHHHSVNGSLCVFRSRTNGRWHKRFPERFGSYFLDCDDKIRLSPSYLVGMHDSPPGTSYPRMSEGYLDFGPDEPCYDSCPLVDKTKLPDYDKVLGVLLHFVLLCRSQLKNWFNNNCVTRVIPKAGRLG